MAKEILAMVLMSGGFFFLAVSAIGLIRMPDVYNRMHALGKCDTPVSYTHLDAGKSGQNNGQVQSYRTSKSEILCGRFQRRRSPYTGKYKRSTRV